MRLNRKFIFEILVKWKFICSWKFGGTFSDILRPSYLSIITFTQFMNLCVFWFRLDSQHLWSFPYSALANGAGYICHPCVFIAEVIWNLRKILFYSYL